ncbi:MAG: hypothetical protein OXI33_06015, partial [Chloroflexota bacterium]|nr:hypothetical protein [Chloroflexota bacterium]
WRCEVRVVVAAGDVAVVEAAAIDAAGPRDGDDARQEARSPANVHRLRCEGTEERLYKDRLDAGRGSQGR